MASNWVQLDDKDWGDADISDLLDDDELEQLAKEDDDDLGLSNEGEGSVDGDSEERKGEDSLTTSSYAKQQKRQHRRNPLSPTFIAEGERRGSGYGAMSQEEEEMDIEIVGHDHRVEDQDNDGSNLLSNVLNSRLGRVSAVLIIAFVGVFMTGIASFGGENYQAPIWEEGGNNYWTNHVTGRICKSALDAQMDTCTKIGDKPVYPNNCIWYVDDQLQCQDACQESLMCAGYSYRKSVSGNLCAVDTDGTCGREENQETEEKSEEAKLEIGQFLTFLKPDFKPLVPTKTPTPAPVKATNNIGPVQFDPPSGSSMSLGGTIVMTSENADTICWCFADEDCHSDKCPCKKPASKGPNITFVTSEATDSSRTVVAYGCAKDQKGPVSPGATFKVIEKAEKSSNPTTLSPSMVPSTGDMDNPGSSKEEGNFTLLPSISPSSSPASSPSNTPSLSPFPLSPSSSPSYTPSLSPSLCPASSPSHTPSLSPSSLSPSSSPSYTPSLSPSLSPSSLCPASTVSPSIATPPTSPPQTTSLNSSQPTHETETGKESTPETPTKPNQESTP